MKRAVLVLCFYGLAIAPTVAQPLANDNTEKTGFFAPVVKLTEVNDESVVLFGGRVGIILNHRLVIGAGFYRLVGDIDAPQAAQSLSDRKLDLDLDYVGLDLAYVFAPRRPIHVSVHTLIGGGSAQYRQGENTVLIDDGIVVFEPGVNVMLKITHFFQIGLGASYRWISDIERLDGLKSRDLTGASAHLTLKFGKF